MFCSRLLAALDHPPIARIVRGSPAGQSLVRRCFGPGLSTLLYGDFPGFGDLATNFVMERRNLLLGSSGNALTEGVVAMLFGFAYGATSVIVGHPFDTIKTRMQTNTLHETFAQSVRAIARAPDGHGGWQISALYRGFWPPLAGSLFFRSYVFSVYGFVYTALDKARADAYDPRASIAHVFVAGSVAGLARAAVESPLELLKTQQQRARTHGQQSWPAGRTLPPWRMWRASLTGYSATAARNMPMISAFFTLTEIANQCSVFMREHPFVRGSSVSVVAWAIVWPLDVVKTRMQARELGSVRAGFWRECVEVYRGGALYRGFVPGALRAFFANGAGMYVYQCCQDWRCKSGVTS